MGIDASSIWQLTNALDSKPEDKTNTRLATVSRIDDEGHVWVSIPGGETETPTETTDVEVERGDTVTVEWRNNKLYVLGNSTQPATSTKRVVQIVEPIEETVNEAAAGVGKAVDASKAAQQAAQEAAAVAEAVDQHFWYRDTDPGDTAGTGAFVTDESQEDFLDAIEQGLEPTEQRPLHNLLMNSEGILLRAAKKWFASFTHSTVTFFDGLGNGVNNIVAQFGANLARIGKASGNHVDITSSGMDVLNGNTSYAQFGSSGARIGQTSSNNIEVSSDGISFKKNTMVLGRIEDDAVHTQLNLDVGDYNTGEYGSLVYYYGASPHAMLYFISDNEVVAEYGGNGLGIGIFTDSTRRMHIWCDEIRCEDDNSNTIWSISDNYGTLIIKAGSSTWGYEPNGKTTFPGEIKTSQVVFDDVKIRGKNNLNFDTFTIEPINSLGMELSTRISNSDRSYLRVKGGNNIGNGMSIRVGAGGLTIIGGGEAADNLYDALGLADDAEQLHLGADGTVYVHSNCNTVANRKTWSFNTDGSLTLPSGSKLGTLATKNSLSITTAGVNGTGKNSSQIAANGTATIQVTLTAPANSVLQGIMRLSCSTWSLVNCGWLCSNYNAVAGTVTVDTYWRNVTGTAVAANSATVTVTGTFMQKQSIS